MLIFGVGIVVAALILLVVAVRMNPGKPAAPLGVHDGRLAPCRAKPNCVCSYDTDSQHAIDPIPFADSSKEAMERLQSAVGSLPGTTVMEASGGYLRAEARSKVFGFVDDVECLVDAESGLIHVRSASRLGHSDLGVNRRRMESLRKAME